MFDDISGLPVYHLGWLRRTYWSAPARHLGGVTGWEGALPDRPGRRGHGAWWQQRTGQDHHHAGHVQVRSHFYGSTYFSDKNLRLFNHSSVRCNAGRGWSCRRKNLLCHSSAVEQAPVKSPGIPRHLSPVQHTNPFQSLLRPSTSVRATSHSR